MSASGVVAETIFFSSAPIADDHKVLETPTQYGYMIGETEDTVYNLEWLGIVPPLGKFERFTVQSTAGNGRTYGDGFPAASWTFDILTNDMFKLLLFYLKGKHSNKVYIRTKTERSTDFPSVGSPVYKTYKCNMHRPKGTRMPGGGVWVRVTIEFSYLEEVLTL
jgi:hypothetical protein